MSQFLNVLMPLAVLAYAFVGGVFLAFSDFIMRSLALTGDSRGARSMQVINREVFRWVFMTLLLGMAVLSVVFVVYAVFGADPQVGVPVALAGLVYLVGCFGVTVVFNVPMNEALDGMDPASSVTGAYWSRTYLPRWTFWNSVRTLACALSAAMLLFGLMQGTGPVP